MDYTVELIQVKAYDQTALPDAECPVPLRTLWWCLRDIYARYKAGTISKETGEQLKQKAMRTYEADRKEYESLRGVQQHQAKMWCNIESAARNYAKSNNRTPEADAFYEVVYGCKLKDGDNNGNRP